MSTRTGRPFPQETPAEFAGHIEGLLRGEFVVPRCRPCDAVQWPPRTVCGRCAGTEFEQVALGELRGEVTTWTIVRRAFHPWFADRVPYGVAVVSTTAGLRLTGWYAGPEVDTLRAGLPVQGSVESLGDAPALVWRPGQVER
mgnify:CR=1 FL=1